MIRYSWLLVLMMGLSACLAPSIKPPVQQAGNLHSILVVAVEPPPLEVVPDLIETRLPLHRQNDNVPEDLFLERGLFRNPGGVLIAGLISRDDVVSALAPAAIAPSGIGLEPIAALEGNWTPTVELARAAAAQLADGGVQASVGSRYYRLPIAAADRTANLATWREAVRQWYNQDVSPVAYASQDAGPVDAVLEVGIGTYRIFDVQAPLQVLVKLVDPVSRQVVGRTSFEAFPAEGSAQTLLDHEAGAFKRLVAETGATLVHRGLRDLGLPAGPPSRSAGAALAKNSPSTVTLPAP